jgi:hypothetical protein
MAMGFSFFSFRNSLIFTATGYVSGETTMKS